MRFLPERTLSSVLLLAALSAILVTLAVLQYRWSGQVSEAERERMQSSLMSSMSQFRQHFSLELQEMAFLFEPGPAVVANREWRSYAETCRDLLDRSQNRLIYNLHLWVADPANPQLLRLDRGAKAFEPASWPAGLQHIRERLQT